LVRGDFNKPSLPKSIRLLRSISPRFKWLQPRPCSKQAWPRIPIRPKAREGADRRHGSWDARRAAQTPCTYRFYSTTSPAKRAAFSNADTVDLLIRNIRARGVAALAGVTGDTKIPPSRHRFSRSAMASGAKLTPSMRYVCVGDRTFSGRSKPPRLQPSSSMTITWAISDDPAGPAVSTVSGKVRDTILCYYSCRRCVETIHPLAQPSPPAPKAKAEVVGTDEAFCDDAPSDKP